ncbi:MAG: hypothetical protein IKD58_07430 [Loktanella sp.]|nr:hypothetical protein [Loktanella sp.]
MAERHVAQGYKHIASQRQIIANFKKRGIDLTLAESLLESFLAIQQTHEYDLRRLTNELNKLADSESGIRSG